MVLSTNENLPPKKATPDKPPPPILHSNKSWARIVRGNVQTSNTPSNPRTSLNTTNRNTTDSPLSESQLRQIATYSERPILKGTVPDSLFIDISTVSNKLLFIQELAAACEGNKHLWSVEDVIRRDFHKAFAEITVSPSFREKICSHGVKLPSFDQLFIGYPSLSSDADILKISFANLPRQYGRGNGGLLELQADMHENLSAFGKVLNCGTTCGLAGVYSGRGYAVLELHQSESSPKLPHVIPWNYTDICSTDPKPISVEVYATWKSMDPYCRYCHGNDHALLNCPKKLSKVTCYNCHGQGHKSKSCPRRNEGGGKKTRKSYESVSEETPSKVLSPSVPLNDPATLSVPPSTIETVDPAASTTSSTQRSKYATVPRMVTRSKSSVSPSSSSLNESTVSPRQCPHCQLEGHVTTRARACLKNPIRLAENANVDHSAFQEDDFVREPIDKQPTDTVDIDMADDTFGFSAESIANLEFQHGHDEAQDGLSPSLSSL